VEPEFFWYSASTHEREMWHLIPPIHVAAQCVERGKPEMVRRDAPYLTDEEYVALVDEAKRKNETHYFRYGEWYAR